MEQKDVREHDGFWKKLIGYVKAGQSVREMRRNMDRDFPGAVLPQTPEHITGWLRSPATWRAFEAVLENRKELELVWHLNGKMRQTKRKGSGEEMTLDEMLGGRTRAPRQKLGAYHGRF